METTAIKTDQTVFIAKEVLASMNSLSIFADHPRNNAPIITGLNITRGGDDTLTVSATNRYVLVVANYSTTAFENWGEEDQLWVDVATLKQAASIAKTMYMPVISIGYDTETLSGVINVSGNKLSYSPVSGEYPPVTELIPTNDPNGTPTLRIKAQWLAMLSKVVTPTVKQDKEMPWDLSFFSETDSRKPMPMLAALSGNVWDINVLIQPNMMVR